jgi:Fic family protein
MGENKRAYERSHPWLTFGFDMEKTSTQFWVLLGEVQAMVEQVASAAMRPAACERLHLLYFAKGVMATTAIEGNTLSEEEILEQLDGKLEVPPSREYLKQETQNIINACNAIWVDVHANRVPPLTSSRIKDFNRQVLEGIENLQEEVVPGEISTYPVTVGGIYSGAPREDCDYLLGRLASWLTDKQSALWPDWTHPTLTGMAVIKAILAHLYVAWIHAFGDGNGRTARLMEFQILAAAGVPSPVAHLLSNHYNKTRVEYYRQLAQSSKSKQGVDSFLLYAAQGLVDGLKEQIAFIQNEQMSLAWHSYVLDTFRQMPHSVMATRRRDLLLDLTNMPGPVPKKSLLGISDRVAKYYAGSTGKMLTRDVNALLRDGLVREEQGGLVANRGIMDTFTPFRRPSCLPGRESPASSTGD